MITTIILSCILMAALFLMILAAVAFIQEKKLFTSAPKDIQEVIQPRNERFHGARSFGYKLLAIAILSFLGAFFYGGCDGIAHGFGFWQFFARFMIMLYAMKAFDILFLDWYLLCHSRFYPHYYPETEELVGPHQFGFNWKTHMMHMILFIPISLVAAWFCALF